MSKVGTTLQWKLLYWTKNSLLNSLQGLLSAWFEEVGVLSCCKSIRGVKAFFIIHRLGEPLLVSHSCAPLACLFFKDQHINNRAIGTQLEQDICEQTQLYRSIQKGWSTWYDVQGRVMTIACFISYVVWQTTQRYIRIRMNHGEWQRYWSLSSVVWHKWISLQQHNAPRKDHYTAIP